MVAGSLRMASVLISTLWYRFFHHLAVGIAAVTTKIKLFASTAILTLPPALCARMAVTIDSIAPGRFGIVKGI